MNLQYTQPVMIPEIFIASLKMFAPYRPTFKRDRLDAVFTMRGSRHKPEGKQRHKNKEF